MKKQIYIALIILLSIFTFILTGCGGGSDGTGTFPSIPEENNNVEYGSIIIKVIWPEGNTSANCNISSFSEENSLTASMPANAQRIEIKVFDREDVDLETPLDEVELATPLNEPV